MNLSATQRSESPRYGRYPHEVPEAKVQLARVTDALSELYELLESYAPAWYTQHHHHKALSALRRAKML